MEYIEDNIFEFLTVLTQYHIDTYTQRIMNIDNEMKLHPVRDTHSTFYEGVQKTTTNVYLFRVQPIKEVHV